MLVEKGKVIFVCVGDFVARFSPRSHEGSKKHEEEMQRRNAKEEQRRILNQPLCVFVP